MKYFEKPIVCECKCECNDLNKNQIEAAAQRPSVGEPKLLTMVSPVVFDECGINLCRTINVNALQDVCMGEAGNGVDILFDGLSACDLLEAYKVQLQVVDIDFNFVNPTTSRFSEIQPAKNRPNLSRVTLKDIDVTFAVTVIGSNGLVSKQGMMNVRYLGCNCSKDDRMNPSCISFDLYTPYGISYASENPAGCNKLVPTINYMGFINGENNTIQQGISAQALAKVVATGCDTMAIGLTLYFKVIYFVQYKFEHQGLTVPPRLKPTCEKERNNGLEFVKGKLLAPFIKPLDVGEHVDCSNGNCDASIPTGIGANECGKSTCNNCGNCGKCECCCCCCPPCPPCPPPCPPCPPPCPPCPKPVKPVIIAASDPCQGVQGAYNDPCQCVVKCPVCHCNPCKCGCTHNC